MHLEDEALMIRAREGDETAFAELVDRHRERVLAFVGRFLRDPVEAEDLAQDVFLSIFRARAGYRPEARFTTWLLRIATNHCLNAVRGRAVRRRVRRLSPRSDNGERPIEELPDRRVTGAGEHLQKAELAARVRAIVDELPESQRTAVLLNKYQDCSYQEVSEIMELSIPAVKSLLSRARTRIKDRLMPYLAGERVW